MIVVISQLVPMFDHNDDYFTAGPCFIDKSQDIILDDNIIDGAEYGNGEEGGVVVITNSREISLSGCHIQNPKINGIQIGNRANVQIADCIIHEETNSLRMLAGITLGELCPGTVI